MDKVTKLFDTWAKGGRSEIMEREHRKTVTKFLRSLSFKKSFSFLDVGCGNGWVVREIATRKNCKIAVGIDKSKNMIKSALVKKISSKENYIQTDLKSWDYRGKFDYIFSMESLYYLVPMEPPLKKLYKLLKRGGQFFCGTDFYTDTKVTKRWKDQMKIPMDLRSKKEWVQMFKDIGFQTKTNQIRDPKSYKKWKREFGTLFIIGKK